MGYLKGEFMKFKPLHDRVLIEVLDSSEKTAGGIIIPDTAQEKPQEGKVVAIGGGAKTEDGKLIPMDVKVGDKVLFGKWSGTEVKIVGKEIDLEDKFENMGAQMVKEVASKTNEEAGDGTTTATILAQAIVKEGVKYVTAGMNPMDVKRGIDAAVENVKENLISSAKKLKDSDEIAQVGTISANGDKEIGNMIAKAMQKVGNEGVITVEEAKGIPM